VLLFNKNILQEDYQKVKRILTEPYFANVASWVEFNKFGCCRFNVWSINIRLEVVATFSLRVKVKPFHSFCSVLLFNKSIIQEDKEKVKIFFQNLDFFFAAGSTACAAD